MTWRTRRRQWATGLGGAVREFVREPVNLALIVALPPIIVVSYGSMMSAFPSMPGMGSPETAGAINGAMYVSAFLPGVIGLFQVISARRADERLTLVGFARPVLFVSRLAAVAIASAVTALIAVSALATRVAVDTTPFAWVVLTGVGLLYGLVGMLVGTVLPRELEGSLVLVFLADVDEVMASGLFETDSALTKLFPLQYPHDVFRSAVVGSDVPVGDALVAVTYGIALFAAAFVVYVKLTSSGGSP